MKTAFYIAITCWIFLIACNKDGGSSGGGGNNNPPPVTVPSPEASVLSLPANNTACLSGVSVDDGNATVTFSWQAAANADSYDLVVKNLVSLQQMTYAVTTTIQDVVLNKSQPYSWYVISKSGKTSKTAQSSVWKFYVAGNPTTSYAPFPATATAPVVNAIIASGGAAQAIISLQWEAMDIDHDIASYAVYLDTKDASTSVISSTVTNTASVSLASRATYYWRVVTTDKAGNSSNSDIFSFSIQ